MEQLAIGKNQVSNELFSESNLEVLLNQLNNYPLAIKCDFIKNNQYSYIKGVQLVMNNLLELYNNVKSSPFGAGKIYALNITVNKTVLGDFFKEIKKDLDITERIFQGGQMDIPVAKNLIDTLIQKYENSPLNKEAFIYGAKRIAKVIHYAYNAPLTVPFWGYINKESKNIVKNISQKLNTLI